MKNIKLDEVKKVYVIGIKGSGVIAVVEILHALGMEITGSDISEKFFTDEILQKLGIKYTEGFSVDNLPSDADLILRAASYNEENNVEVAEAKKRGLQVVYYPEILADLFNEKYGVAVCGTHGKTTTSAMLATVLEKIGKDPTAVIGGRVKEWGGNAISGESEYFVIEADEYQNKLALYEPKGVILTSVEYDHPDFYPTLKEYKKVFADFVAKIPQAGFLVAWGNSVDTLEIAKSCKAEVMTYGFGEDVDFRIFNFQFSIFNEFPNSNDKIKKPIQSFEIIYKNENLGKFEIQLVGKHNVLNAAAVVGACHQLGFDLQKVREALFSFAGTTRRFELIGERNGAKLIDDYGHHPEEINLTLKAAKEIYPDKNIIAVFHPHSYSRTEALLHDFAQSFDGADQVIVLDIYGSARENSGKVSSIDLVNLINKYNRDKAEYIATIDETVEHLQDKIGPNDIVITIGAGNGWEVAEKLKEK